MYDNKVRLSHDVLEKAERIAAEWGLKNARAAVEAVFRRYCDDYLYGRPQAMEPLPAAVVRQTAPPVYGSATLAPSAAATTVQSSAQTTQCEALDALDQLLAL
jgi:hypothetical protein